MTDDLVKRLRDFDPHLHEWEVVDEAAGRIEALTADFERQVQRTDEQREVYEQALSVMEADNERLRAALFDWIDMMNDPSTKLRRKVVEFYSIAIAALR